MASKTKVKWALLAAVAVIAVGAGVWVWWDNAGLHVDPRKGPLKPAARFELQDDAGRKRSIEEFRGKVVVLHFWATWCAPCIEEIPQWVELARKFRGKPIVFVAVSLDQKWEDAHRYLDPKKLPDNVVSLLDPDTKVPDLYGSYQFPESYLLTPDLMVLSKWVGQQEWEGARMSEVLDRVIELTVGRKG